MTKALLHCTASLQKQAQVLTAFLLLYTENRVIERSLSLTNIYESLSTIRDLTVIESNVHEQVNNISFPMVINL